MSHSVLFSSIFDIVGIPGVFIAGWALDRVFKGKWTSLCLLMGIGMAISYVAVVIFGGNPYAFAICCGAVGFMLYGPDSIISGAAAMQVAGEKNAAGVAGIINGVGSIGPIVQEEVISKMMEGDNGIHNANVLGLAMSVLFVVAMVFVSMQVKSAHKKHINDR